MSALRAFTEQSREQIVRSAINKSTSKNLWTFSKEKRFPDKRSNCPQLAYEKDVSTISNKKMQFGNSRRKIFTQVSQAPTSWIYNPSQSKNKLAATFGESREKCVNNSYICTSLAKNPGPGRYIYQAKPAKLGFTMRPKTANNRNYFIDNKQQADVPSPCDYNVRTSREGRATISKFKTIMLGGSGLNTKVERFKQFAEKTPSSWIYNPAKPLSNNRIKGGKIGSHIRLSFIDEVSHNDFTPGPGNYKMPTQFGHYKRSALSLAH